MIKAVFSRKAKNMDEIKKRAACADYGCQANPVVIEKIITLPVERWEHFKENLLDDFDFIGDNVKLQYVDTNGVWHCIGIMAEGGSDLIFGNCEGYGYLRYSSYLPDASELIAEQKKPVLSDKVIEQIMDIRAAGKYNLFDVTNIQREAYEKGFHELVIFLDDHKKEYANFILYGQR